MQRFGKIIIVLFVLVCFYPFLNAEDIRSFPLDFYLIIDDSESFHNAKDNAIAWVNGQVLDRLLMEGDSVTIWAAGETARILYSGNISSLNVKKDIQETIRTLRMEGKTADFSGALRELEPRLSRTPQDRLSYSVLVTASAEGLSSTLTGKSQSLLRWFRTEKYERWQALILAPNIDQRVNQAASSYINSFR